MSMVGEDPKHEQQTPKQGETPRIDSIVARYRPYAGAEDAEAAFDRISHEGRKLERELEALKEAMAEVDSTLFHSLTVGMLRERAAEILAEILAEKEKKQ